MAGGASADPPPAWLIVLTMATFLSFFIAYNDTLPTVTLSGGCGDIIACTLTVFSAFGSILVLLFDVVTLGGFSGVLPVLIQAPLFFFFAITWGIIIVKMITNTAGAVIP